ncbi:cancer/testis antigen 55-like [Microtus ochrogaster]|uniref:Cancer/testis antigen 55-like n=1 Tax=Microtus ochrogaster TaxID=79684 RepID=A0ABM1APP1_MICOH|nr:cancer/testis antigen 55-like [Microtus ochrogaster]
MHRVISKFRAFFQRKADSEEEREEKQRLLEGAGMFQTMKGVATGSCSGYGYPNEHILNAGVMVSKELLKVKQKGPKAVEIDEIIRGLDAITVGAYCRGHDEPPERHMTVSLDCIKSLMDGVDHINHDLSFSLDIVCKDFEPYKGDLVEIEFSEQGDPQSGKAISVKPLKHYHINEVSITRADGRTGVLEDTVFFTLDSLKLPSGYVPQRDDIVNVVAVQSIQSPYFWRAITMTPVQVS